MKPGLYISSKQKSLLTISEWLLYQEEEIWIFLWTASIARTVLFYILLFKVGNHEQNFNNYFIYL